MADKVKHWPSWAMWVVKDSDGEIFFLKEEPRPGKYSWLPGDGSWHHISMQDNEFLELVEIDPATPWQESKQRRPE